MAKLNVSRVEVKTGGTPGAKLNVSRVEVAVTPPAVPTTRLNVSRVEVSVAAPVTRLNVSRVEITVAQSLTRLNVSRVEVVTATPVSAGADIIGVEPGTRITLAGSGGDAGGTPTWAQVSGPAAGNVVQSGASVSFDAPPSTSAASVVFRYSVSGAFDDVTVSVLAATEWAATSSGWVGIISTG